MNSNEVWPLTLLLVSLGITVAFVLLGRRLHKLSLTLLTLISVWAVVWSVGLGLHESDWHNITGWVDCRDSCTAWQGVGAWLIFGPPVAVVVAVIAAAVVAAIDRLRRMT